MRAIVLAIIAVMILPLPSIAWDTESFKWGTAEKLSESSQWEIDHYKGDKTLFAFVDRGPIVFETRKGEEYGYIVDSVIVHDFRTGKSFYIYCWDFEREKKTDMRGIEPEYTNFKLMGNDKVEIEVKKKGKIDGHGILDVKTPSFEYKKANGNSAKLKQTE